MDLNSLWFVLLGVLLAGYAVLDGFDLGAAIMSRVARTDQERRIVINAIGPLWDGNEVWLVTFGGALFAAFPEAYATIFSGFYAAFMAVLFALIFRAVAIEFRSKLASPWWRRVWDFNFFASSLLASFVYGVSVGAAMDGVPLNERGVYMGTTLDQISPYAVLVGAMTVAMFAMHGAIFLYLKTEGELQQRLHGWMWRTFGSFLALYLAVTIATLVYIPRTTQTFIDHPWAWTLVVLNVLAIANIPRAIHLSRPGYAFVSSSATIMALVALFGIALFPNLVSSLPQPENSLTVYNAASSPYTLKIMTIIAALGMPFVIAYTAVVYWTFRGKVKLGPHSY
ncbi:MAG: cytochrome d ubiquinol oxidase subunit II [Planctomycetaceae bacterium]|nr:cytochrome d ubiquinol oxidase subunit II [Planctomycetaceae bacterium]